MTKSRAIAAVITLWMLTGSALAQSNTLTIQQSGNSNQLYIDQSAASNSSVQGLTLETAPRTFTLTDGDGIETDIGIDVLTFAPAETALQSGNLNEAEITQTGDGSSAFLSQQSTGTDGNQAFMDLLGSGSSGAIGQVGSGNLAELEAFTGATGAILQQGDNNAADLSVGAGGEGLISQIGDGNDSGAVTVAPGASLSYIQQGNGLQPVNPGQGVQVFTTAPGGVTITQTGGY